VEASTTGAGGIDPQPAVDAAHASGCAPLGCIGAASGRGTALSPRSVQMPLSHDCERSQSSSERHVCQLLLPLVEGRDS
jgi:hypothetical protein